MKALRNQAGWVGISYAVVWGPLWLLYERLNRSHAAQWTGEIPAAFWILTFLYFVVDVLLVLGLNLLGRMASKGEANEPFWHLVSEIVPVWFLIHLSLLCIGRPVSQRLESVGLGIVEIIVGAATLVAAAAFIVRGVASERGVG